MILASKDANCDYIVADLEAQIEHHNGIGILVTNSKKLVMELRNRKTPGFILLVNNLDVGCEAVNRIAPEHLEILTRKPSLQLKKIKNAGAIFLGETSPVSLGDYTAGPSHVLPTGGSARFFSCLSLRNIFSPINFYSLWRLPYSFLSYLLLNLLLQGKLN